MFLYYNIKSCQEQCNKIFFEVWLSLVERCVRDAEVAGSNPVTSTKKKHRTEKYGVNKEVFSARLEIVLRNFLFIGNKLFLRSKFTDEIKYNLYLLYSVSA